MSDIVPHIRNAKIQKLSHRELHRIWSKIKMDGRSNYKEHQEELLKRRNPENYTAIQVFIDTFRIRRRFPFNHIKILILKIRRNKKVTYKGTYYTGDDSNLKWQQTVNGMIVIGVIIALISIIAGFYINRYLNSLHFKTSTKPISQQVVCVESLTAPRRDPTT